MEVEIKESAMAKILTAHIVEGDQNLILRALDDEGFGGAHHVYEVTESLSEDELPVGQTAHIIFQNGPAKEVGMNGVQHIHLLAMIADRLRAFQRSEFACDENAACLAAVEQAMHWDRERTRRRIAQKTEGQNIESK